MAEMPRWESFNATGGQILELVQSLIHEGNVRRIIIKQEGRTLVEFPLTFGVVGAVLAPTLAAVGAVAALVTQCTIEVERVDTSGSGGGAAGGASGQGGSAGQAGASGRSGDPSSAPAAIETELPPPSAAPPGTGD